MRHLTTATLTILLTALCVHAQATGREQRPPAQSSDATPLQGPGTSVQSQTEAPLRLSVNTKWVTPEKSGYEISFSVENASARTVRAYAIRGIPGTSPNGCAVINILSLGKVLKQGQSKTWSTWRGYDPNQPASTLSVDYVEFTDDGTWGADLCGAREQLAGERAGGRAATCFFQKMLQESTADEMLRIITKDRIEFLPPRGHPATWEDGFRSGTSVIHSRLTRANEEWGWTELDYTLRRPYDASGAR